MRGRWRSAGVRRIHDGVQSNRQVHLSLPSGARRTRLLHGGSRAFLTIKGPSIWVLYIASPAETRSGVAV